ncbi:MAG: PorV/PorQ family protein [Candidatus Latescibacterota bacterium]
MASMKNLLLVCALLLPGVQSAVSQTIIRDSSEAGLPFLRIIPTAANAGLGGAGVALFSGSASLWMNPSLIASGDTRSAQYSHTEFMKGIRQEFASFSAGTGIGNFGASVQLYDSGDMDGYGSNAEPTGTFSIKYVALSLGYARKLTDDISLGVAYKKLFEKVADENADGYAVDAGITWKTPVEGLTAAAVARNNGRMGILKNDRTRLPSDVGAGVVYRGFIPNLGRPVTFAADYVAPRYGDSGVRLGVQVEPVDRFFVRAGYRSDSDYEDLSFGVGLDLGVFAADVSYTPMEEFSENALRFTLSLTGF